MSHLVKKTKKERGKSETASIIHDQIVVKRHLRFLTLKKREREREREVWLESDKFQTTPLEFIDIYLESLNFGVVAY